MPIDLGLLRSVFFTPDADADFNGDGIVNVVDLGILRSGFFDRRALLLECNSSAQAGITWRALTKIQSSSP